MGLFFMSWGSVARSAGEHVVAAAMYQAAENGKDERTGKWFRFAKEKNMARIVESRIVFPPDARTRTRQEFWNDVEKSEGDRKASRTARQLMIALDNDMSEAWWIKLAGDFVDKNFTKRGLVADYAIHSGGKNSSGNPHIHILIATRLIDPETGELDGKKFDELNKQSFLRSMRDSWSRFRNEARVQAGKEPDDSRAKTDAARVHFDAQKAMPEIIAGRREVFAKTLEMSDGDNLDRRATAAEIAEMCKIAIEESPDVDVKKVRREVRAVARQISGGEGITVGAIIRWMKELAFAARESVRVERSGGI